MHNQCECFFSSVSFLSLALSDRHVAFPFILLSLSGLHIWLCLSTEVRCFMSGFPHLNCKILLPSCLLSVMFYAVFRFIFSLFL